MGTAPNALRSTYLRDERVAQDQSEDRNYKEDSPDEIAALLVLMDGLDIAFHGRHSRLELSASA